MDNDEEILSMKSWPDIDVSRWWSLENNRVTRANDHMSIEIWVIDFPLSSLRYLSSLYSKVTTYIQSSVVVQLYLLNDYICTIIK